MTDVGQDTIDARNRAGSLSGDIVFVGERERQARTNALAEVGMLVAHVPGVLGSARGRIASEIGHAIERELRARGGAPPGPACDAEGRLKDQLRRARRSGATGLCVSLGSLHAAVGTMGALEAPDGATLRLFAHASRFVPLVLLLDEADETLGAFADPVSLARLLAAPPAPVPTSVVPPSAMETTTDVTAAAEAEAIATEATNATPFEAAPAAPAAPPTPAVATSTRPAGKAVAAPSKAGPKVHGRDDSGPWRTWTHQLLAARGPQPLSAFEKIFAQSYLPLSNAIAGGLDDAHALQAHEEFRRNFERVYTEACPTFAVTGKRPPLVIDIPQIAARIARLHGARSVHLLLVDSMRFDLGVLVKERLLRALDGRASLTDEMVLWSALPTVTSRQLEGIGRGIDVLRTAPEVDREPDAIRGRTAEIVRRIKVGPRDLFKLDYVESKLLDAADRALAILPEVADAVSTIVVRHSEHLAPRTLLVVFGDHGFTVDPRARSVASSVAPSVASQGGASPEEVLVPAYAFLTGAPH